MVSGVCQNKNNKKNSGFPPGLNNDMELILLFSKILRISKCVVCDVDKARAACKQKQSLWTCPMSGVGG